MGTRCLTIFKEADGEEIAVLYRQIDGHPEGHGDELDRFLEEKTLVNGLPMKDNPVLANGMPCLAAQVVAHFKTEPGSFYLHPAGTRNIGEEYLYTVEPANPSGLGPVKLSIESVRRLVRT